ncbi:DNA gyrase subunit A [Candidatus Magnetaquicoccaceae bacterium FCR-1]|uniref:DNA gyrase subunit A n=1 Tax=Candidatus Magnetaquiglobus chichijimensis TaxID=3141448 RepID=A0ABQ0CBP9_9PROT
MDSETTTVDPNLSKRVPVNLEDEMRRSYLDYAMSVIVGRALPDVRDGLKPVHRRVLYAMSELGNEWNRAYKKSARVVGDVIGKYHPHGDVAVYDTIVRMAQEFSMRHPLVDGQGNFGSVDGDSPAAMRYTEVRMTRLAGELLADIDKETVDFGPNYDGSLTEPRILPCKFPNLLVSGSSGIAVGMATNIPPHNLGEVVDATCALIDNPELTNRGLMTFVPGPDFPTGGSIHGRAGIVSAYETGRGSIVLRAKTHVETKKDGREAIIIDELPFQVNKAKLVEFIADLVREKKIDGISDLRDESDRQGMRVVIETKRDASTEVLLNQLYKHTAMQTTFGVNAVALVHGQPQTLSLKSILEEFINHRRQVVTRRTLFDLAKAQARGHILEGLSVALANIDRIIELIRNAPNPQTAKERLVAEVWARGPVEAMLARALEAGMVASPQFVEGGYRLSPEQAQAILDMRLHRLTGLEQDKIHQEFEETLTEIARLNAILASDQALLTVIKDELTRIKEMFANARRTEIVEDLGEFCAEDLIPEEEMVVTVSHSGYVKRQPAVDYRSQRRGGKGKSATGVRDEDFISQLFVASTHDPILCFTDKGRVFRLKVHELPLASRAARGRPIINLLALEGGEKLAQILPAPVARDQWDNWHLLFATAKGLIKKTALSAYANIRASGIRAVDLQEGDDLVGVALLPVLQEDIDAEAVAAGEGDEDGTTPVEVEPVVEPVAEEEPEESGETRPGRILLYSSSGKAARFRTGQVRLMGRVARGVRGMRLRGEDRVIALNVLTNEPDCQILAITENGFGKRTEAERFPTKGRGSQGVIGMLIDERNGPVVASLVVSPGDQIMVITDQGTVLRTPVESVRQTGRNARGVKVLDVSSSGERVVSVARIAEAEEDAVVTASEDGESDGMPMDEGGA